MFSALKFFAFAMILDQREDDSSRKSKITELQPTL
jgi:hypothetical protein